MRRRMIPSLVAGMLPAIAIAATALVCRATPPPPAPPVKEPPPVRLEDLRFSSGAVQTKLHKIDAAARRLAGRQWIHEPYRNKTYRGGPARYVARWHERPHRNPNLGYTPREPFPNHAIDLHGHSLKAAGDEIDGLNLYATYIPEQGWGARIEYQTHDGQARIGEMFALFFFHRDFNKDYYGNGRWALELGNSHLGTAKRVGDYSYHFQVSMYGDPKTWMGDTKTPRDGDVRRYLSSAEGFRDAALAELDALEKHAREQIPSGAALREVLDYRNVRSDYPPKPAPPDIRPDAKLLDAVLGEALADIAQRRRLVRDHFREMFAATRTAFPLVECLEMK